MPIQPHFFEKNYSLTEWFEQLENFDVAAIRKEDNEKRDRLSVLNSIIGIPYDKPYTFAAIEVDITEPEFQDFLEFHGDELCAIRLVPLDPTLPKLRIRGKNIRESVDWFNEQTIEKEKYKVEFVPHAESLYASIFIVNENGIFGELVKGAHSILTQGISKNEERLYFSFDFQHWKFVGENENLQKHAQEIVGSIKVEDKILQQQLYSQLNAKFIHDYLCGYFETSYDETRGLWFIDYNRIVGKKYIGFFPETQKESLVRGQIGNPGKVDGEVLIVTPENIPNTKVTLSHILVCDMTDPSYLPLMKQAAGFITNQGGILSHAAIVARELGKPCVVATGNATEILKNGDKIQLNANTGEITKI